ncbi:hypothetical protein Vretifemale_9427 [Volvox reticuliferus]|nr:hypothetical protein Vretifemale_9427 [Volvox reticuliferus]
MPPTLTYRMTSALVRPAVQQISQDLQLQQRRILTIRADDCGGGAGGGENASRVSTSALPMAEAPRLYESVRLLGALASAAASLCDSVAEWRERNTTRGDGGSGDGGSSSGSSESRTSSLSRSGRMLPRGRRSSETGFPAPPVDLRRTGLRLALWEAGWLAVRTASSCIKDEQDLQRHEHQVQRLLSPFSPPSIPLRDWCSYLAGLRRLGFRPPLDLSTALLEYLALPGPLAQLQTCSVREIVALACELSYIAARRPQRRLPYSAAKLRLLRRQVRAAPQGSALAAAHCQVAGLLPVNEDAVEGGLRTRGLAAERYVRNGGGGGDDTSADIGFGGEPRQRHRRIDWLVQSRVGPALLAAAQRMGEGSGSGGGTAARPPMVSVRQAATLLRALRRLRLQLPAPVLAALMRASAGGSGAIAWSPSTDLADIVRMAMAVAAAMPVLPTTTSNLQAEARGTGSAASSPVPLMAVESRTESAAVAEAVAGAIKSTSNDALAEVEMADGRMSVAAADWLAHIAARTEAHLVAAPPIVLLEVLLPLVAELVEAARRADWMQDVVQSRILAATFAACIRTLRDGGAPLLFISRLLDALLALTVSRPPVRRRSTAAGGAPSNGGRTRGLRTRTRFAPSQPTKGRPPLLDVRLPDDLWIAVYRASYRQMATALPLAAASVAATATATGISTSASVGSGAAVAALAAEAAGGSDRVAMTSSDVAAAAAAASAPSPSPIIASGNAGVGGLARGDGASQGPFGPRRLGASEAAVQPLEGRKPSVELFDRGGRTAPVCTAATTVLGRQVIMLAYSLARHPPLRPPPDRWMRLMLLAVEADLASLGAWECANLCVSLVRLGCVPGASWLDRFGLQVELIRALTEKTEHTLLSRAWLGLRQLRDRQNHQSQQKQQQLNEQPLAPGDCGAPLTDKKSD